MAKKAPPRVPNPVKHEGRICFGIDYFTSARAAEIYGAMVTLRGDTYNGGWYDGMPCGRAPCFDYKDDVLGPLFAVTVS